MTTALVPSAGHALVADTIRHAVLPDAGTARTLRHGMVAVAALVAGFGGVAALVPIQGAAIAPGEVDVDSRVKPISHPTGGVVSAVLVREGDHVRRGQVMMRFDDRVTGAQSHYLGAGVDQLLADQARLVAVRDGGAIAFPAALTTRAGNPEAAAILAAARSRFAADQAALASQRGELEQQIRQTRATGSASQARGRILAQQQALIGRELDMVRSLYAKRYTTVERLNALERSALELKSGGETAATDSIQAGAHVRELEARIASLAEQSRATAAKELAEVELRLADLRRAKAGADDSFDRSVIRASADGTVDKLILASAGTSVPAGEPLMQIVPDRDALVARVRVPVDDIDQVAPGRAVRVRFNALDARATPELEGVLSELAPNRTVDQRTGATYYAAIVRIAPGQQRRLDGARLRPGMTVEAYVQSSSRTLMQLILRPLTHQMRRAFRHD